MKRDTAILLCMGAVIALGGCAPKTQEQAATEHSVEEIKSAEPSVTEEEERRLAFGKVLWDVYQKGVLPDGRPLDQSLGTEFAVDNEFALVDVDNDGEEELLLFWENACMAGMMGLVFGYDGETGIREELLEFPTLTFYNNGIVEVEASHNQGLAGAFWPYSVYRYDEESGIYQSLGYVDAWDISVREENYEGEPFPTDIDADGDGLVYYIIPANGGGGYDMPPMDGPSYEEWRNAYIDGAEEIDIPRQKMTEENIAALGCPKPDSF